MPKGKPWSHNQEKRLRGLVSEGANIVNMVTAFNCKPDAIRKKLDRLGLKVVVQKSQKTRTTTSTLLPKDIITHEQTPSKDAVKISKVLHQIGFNLHLLRSEKYVTNMLEKLNPEQLARVKAILGKDDNPRLRKELGDRQRLSETQSLMWLPFRARIPQNSPKSSASSGCYYRRRFTYSGTNDKEKRILDVPVSSVLSQQKNLLCCLITL